ncbi:hypothetical protein C4J81_18060 [Deltaproteobacteria bacterium Smac51]|nr:hypothetical protein C4J81_18060 [Deltaproteobacteria bacterium Smac51]
MKFLANLFEAAEDKAGPLCIAVLMLVLGLQVVGRALGFGSSLTWTDEAARTLFVWSVFLSLPLASKRGALVHIKLSEKLWPAAWRPYMIRFSSILWTATCLFLAGLTAMNIEAHSEFPQLTPILGLNQNHLFLVMPLAFLMIFIRGLCDIFRRPGR